MHTFNLSSCYYPTTVLVVDDNPAFLTTISLMLNRDYILAMHDKPESALHVIANSKSPLIAEQNFLAELRSEEIDSVLVTQPLFYMDLAPLYREIYNPLRFTHVSAVLVDYSMPTMNGGDFCRKLKELPLKKIMLTGEADHRIAVELFNDGIIDKFILKDTPAMYEEINAALFAAKQAYFKQLSQPLFNALIGESYTALLEPIFIEILHQLCQDKHVSEYYLLDAVGSFLLLDKDANPTWLLVRSETMLQELEDVAVGNQAAPALIASLQRREKMPCFVQEADHHSPVNCWPEYFYPVKQLAGKDTNYYYTVIEDKNFGKLDHSRILSHRAYLHKLRA